MTSLVEEIVVELKLLQRNHNFRILSEHIKGEENVEADTLSREWTSEITTRLGKVRSIKIDPKLYVNDVVKLLIQCCFVKFDNRNLIIVRFLSFGSAG